MDSFGMGTWETGSAGPEETGALGCRLGSLLRPGDVIFLLGGLGAGKTRLAQGIADSLGIPAARSPSFALVHVHRGRLPLYHADLYRLADAAEVRALDLAGLSADGVLVVEWPQLAASEFPERLEVELIFAAGDEHARRIVFRPLGERYAAITRELSGLADPGI